MPDNRQAHSNAVSNPPSDTGQEAVWRLKVRDNQEGDAARSLSYPDRPGEPDCIYYLRTGLCGYGSNCRFHHPINGLRSLSYKSEFLPQRVGQPDCGYFLKTGTCKYGSSCKYHHPQDRHGAAPVYLNILGLPMRQDEKACAYYMRTGLCKFGAACKFDHPQPALPGSVLTVAGNTAGGAMGSTTGTSPRPTYIGGLSTWSLPRPPYISGTRVQGPQGYIPLVYSPSQGVLSSHGWNTYMGTIAPTSAGILGSSVSYNSRNKDESGSSGEMHILPTSVTSLPQRPDQPECRHFMITGSCKYGSTCKFHHPKEKAARFANTLSPSGLPSRPGQPVCSNYRLYGLCKYGPTCKFDHPVAGYSFNYGLGFPSVSMIDPPLLSYPRNPLSARASETSLSREAKVTEWIQKPEPSGPQHHESSGESPEDQSVGTDSPAQSLPTSEIHQESGSM